MNQGLTTRATSALTKIEVVTRNPSLGGHLPRAVPLITLAALGIACGSVKAVIVGILSAAGRVS